MARTAAWCCLLPGEGCAVLEAAALSERGALMGRMHSFHDQLNLAYARQEAVSVPDIASR
eukprot:1330754-Rhodomonas_salina.2